MLFFFEKVMIPQSFLPRMILALALPLELAVILSAPGISHSQSASKGLGERPLVAQSQRTRRTRRLSFRPPSFGAPARRRGASVRGGCGASQEQMIPILPEITPALTAAEYPTLLVYLPETTAQTAELVVRNARTKEIMYKVPFTLSAKAGVLGLNLPTDGTLPALEVGQNYNWTFSVICDANDRSGDMAVSGQVRRVEVAQNLSKELETTPVKDRPALYAESGLWYDAVESLMRLRLAAPNDVVLKTDWKDLLRSVKLDAIVEKPLIS